MASDMTVENFSRALKLVLIDEGGLDDDPHDHGGRTAYGIIQKEYDRYRFRKNLPQQDVWKITPAEYTEIYHDQYWMPWCDKLPAGVDYSYFDTCVNAGAGQGTRTLRKALGLTSDSIMTADVVAKVQATDAVALISRFADVRRAFYRSLAQFHRYGRGWLARVDHVEKNAKAMAVGKSATPIPAPLPPPPDIEPPPAQPLKINPILSTILSFIASIFRR